MISIGVVEMINNALITVVEVKPTQTRVLKRVGPVNIIRKIIPGCFLIKGNSFIALEKQKGVKMINAMTHRQKPRDKGETKFSTEASLPIIKLPDQNSEAKHKKMDAFKELFNG